MRTAHSQPSPLLHMLTCTRHGCVQEQAQEQEHGDAAAPAQRREVLLLLGGLLGFSLSPDQAASAKGLTLLERRAAIREAAKSAAGAPAAASKSSSAFKSGASGGNGSGRLHAPGGRPTTPSTEQQHCCDDYV